ncbi:MAG: COX15/CtaA family protein [Candidatus Rokuibacteriota bacterium]
MTVAHRLAVLTSGATLVLILAGGLVTNTGSALAVPDWPTTFGHNMFLYPWSQMVGGVFYEHSHRLLGSLVGLLTLALAAALWRVGGGLRVAGVVAAIAVVAQGVLGGLRVVLLQDVLAILHGCLAQAFFALVAGLALATSPRARLPVAPLEPGVRTGILLAAVLVYLQIVFGALLTHAGWLEMHLLGALAVFALVPVAAARLRRSGDAVAEPLARSLLVLLAVQLVLGVAALVARLAPELVPAAALVLVLPAAHRLAGSLILATAVLLAFRVWSAVKHVPPLVEAAEATP